MFDQSHQHLFQAEIRASSSCTESYQPVSMVISKTLIDLLWLYNMFKKNQLLVSLNTVRVSECSLDIMLINGFYLLKCIWVFK